MGVLLGQEPEASAVEHELGAVAVLDRPAAKNLTGRLTILPDPVPSPARNHSRPALQKARASSQDRGGGTVLPRSSGHPFSPWRWIFFTSAIDAGATGRE